MIVIAGFGFVGSAVFETAIKSIKQVAVVDPKIGKETIRDYPQAEGLIVCVPTPSTKYGYEIEYLQQVLDKCKVGLPILIKSTISPRLIDEIEATWPQLDITYSPEYLTERNANEDFAKQKIAHMGGHNVAFWRDIYRQMLPDCVVRECDPKSLVLSKMIKNAYLGTKVAFFNQVWEVCKNNNIDYNELITIIKDDTRIGDTHMQVPGFDKKRGYGGSCFPKDIDALLAMSHKVFSILEEVKDYNNSLRE